MKTLLLTLSAVLFLSSGMYLIAIPPSDLGNEPPAPAPGPPGAPAPPSDPSVPPKPSQKRCGLDMAHKPHEWTDNAGKTFQCDGGAEFRAPGHDPLEFSDSETGPRSVR